MNIPTRDEIAEAILNAPHGGTLSIPSWLPAADAVLALFKSKLAAPSEEKITGPLSAGKWCKCGHHHEMHKGAFPNGRCLVGNPHPCGCNGFSSVAERPTASVAPEALGVEDEERCAAQDCGILHKHHQRGGWTHAFVPPVPPSQDSQQAYTWGNYGKSAPATSPVVTSQESPTLAENLEAIRKLANGEIMGLHNSDRDLIQRLVAALIANEEARNA